MFYTIYKITNLMNGKIYIGKHQTKDPNDKYYGSGKAIVNAIKLHGKENFKKEILYIFETELEMNSKEKELIDEEFVARTDTYNLGVGGEGGPHFKGKTFTDDIKRKISRLGSKTSDETKNKIAEINKLTNKSRGEKVSIALKGKFKTEEHKKKISESIKRRYEEKKDAEAKMVHAAVS